MIPPLIALEEHFDSQAFEASDDLHANLPSHLHERLRDIGDLRIQDLDNGKTQLQVISHIGVDTPAKGCVQANDQLAAACKKFPDRLAGFATLPMYVLFIFLRETILRHSILLSHLNSI